MNTQRRKKADLAIDTILRGLEFDQVEFSFDDGARPESVTTGASAEAADHVRWLTVGTAR